MMKLSPKEIGGTTEDREGKRMEPRDEKGISREGVKELRGSHMG